MRSALLVLGAALCLAVGCSSTDDVVGSRGPQPQATSLTGQPLYKPPLTDSQRAKLEADLAQALAAYEADSTEDNAIWLGRRLAYLGRYREAIEVFTVNIARYPASYKLLRHRGHRYITVRELDLAVADLTRASFLIASVPDEVEPDGAPNPSGIPRSTSHSNIWYHLALAYYLKGDFARAAECWGECMKFSANDDMKVATANWLYVSLRRAGKPEEAAAVLEILKPEMEILENEGYLELLQAYKKGEVEPMGKVILAIGFAGNSDEGTDPIQDSTKWYGFGNWQLINGDVVGAELIFQHTLRSPNWAPFGYIAAEAEFARQAK